MVLETGFSIQDLCWQYDNQVSKNALTDISLSIPAGRFTAVIGPNGSGKTTLIKLLLQTMRPERNTIFLDGRDIREFSRKEWAMQMAAVPQSPLLDQPFTAEQIVMMGRYVHQNRWLPISQTDRKLVEAALLQTDTLQYRNQMINRLSGGEAQRVIIARALAQESPVLALDEPTNHLDLRHQIEVLSFLKSLTSKGKTVIAVLHDMNLALEYSDYLVLLNEGRLQAAGTPESVLTRENLKTVYGVEGDFIRNPFSNKPYLVSRLSK